MCLCKLISVLYNHVLDSTMIYCDNQSCVENLVFHDMLKHIEIKYYILRDKFERGEVVLMYISTNEQIKYVFVKPLCKMKIFCT
jgi:hypothetical protein